MEYFGETLRLGQLIDLVSRRPKDQWVRFNFGGLQPTRLASYRGYYDQLALGWQQFTEPVPTVENFLAHLRSAVGETFQGYKGGHYRMDDSTPVWVSNYGHAENTTLVGIADCDYYTILQTGYES